MSEPTPEWWHLYRPKEGQEGEPYLHGPSNTSPEQAATLGNLLSPPMDYVKSWDHEPSDLAQKRA